MAFCEAAQARAQAHAGLGHRRPGLPGLVLQDEGWRLAGLFSLGVEHDQKLPLCPRVVLFVSPGTFAGSPRLAGAQQSLRYRVDGFLGDSQLVQVPGKCERERPVDIHSSIEGFSEDSDLCAGGGCPGRTTSRYPLAMCPRAVASE